MRRDDQAISALILKYRAENQHGGMCHAHALGEAIDRAGRETGEGEFPSWLDRPCTLVRLPRWAGEIKCAAVQRKEQAA